MITRCPPSQLETCKPQGPRKKVAAALASFGPSINRGSVMPMDNGEEAKQQEREQTPGCTA